MGFFDIFKKKKPEKQEKHDYISNDDSFKRQDKVKIKGDLESGITFDYYISDPNFRKFYDTVCLQISDTQPIFNIFGTKVYNALVSWYGEDDAVPIRTPALRYSLRRMDTKSIQLGLDFSKLSDSEYLKTLFRLLLNQNRVEQYLDNGLQENSAVPCGNYIGQLCYTPEKGIYQKQFDMHIGEISHNSTPQVERRRQHKLKLEERKRNSIKEKQEQIAKLQQEIDDINLE